MGWAHEGAAISSIATIATWTRAAGLGGGGLEFAAACWIDEVPGPTGVVPGLCSEVPGPGSEVPGPVGTVPGPGSKVPGLASTVVFLRLSTGALESDPTTSGGAHKDGV